MPPDGVGSWPSWANAQMWCLRRVNPCATHTGVCLERFLLIEPHPKRSTTVEMGSMTSGSQQPTNKSQPSSAPEWWAYKGGDARGVARRLSSPWPTLRRRHRDTIFACIFTTYYYICIMICLNVSEMDHDVWRCWFRAFGPSGSRNYFYQFWQLSPGRGASSKPSDNEVWPKQPNKRRIAAPPISPPASLLRRRGEAKGSRLLLV